MNVPITFPKSNNILLAVRIGQLGAEFLSDVNLRHSLKRTLWDLETTTHFYLFTYQERETRPRRLWWRRNLIMSDNGAHKILCRLCSLREKYLPVPSPLLILYWQGPAKQFLWWNKYAFISLVQTRSLLKEEEREKFKPFLPLISSLFAAISPRPQTKKAKLRRLLSPCKLHL